MSSPPPARVVVRLPWERPEDAQDPTPIEWNAQKADILWKTIEKSRSSNKQALDWKALSARLDVPLPYLLYRAHTRFQEELRGIQNMQGALSPEPPQHQPSQSPESPLGDVKFSIATRTFSGSSATRLSSSSRLSTPISVRARLTSLGHGAQRPRKTVSSSTITVQGPSLKSPASHPPRPPSPASLSGSDSDEQTALLEEAAEREAEEEEILNRKLRDLQQLVKNDGLGLVTRSPDQRRPRNSTKSKQQQTSRGRVGLTLSQPDLRREVVHSTRSASHSLSNTSESSPQGSIPEIPSPPQSADVISQPQSPISRHMSSNKSSSPPALSPRSALAHSHRRYSVLMDQSSNQGSEASSFSDLSDASLSASALESALMSNIRGGNSRFSAFARNRLAHLGRSNSTSGNGIIPH